MTEEETVRFSVFFRGFGNSARIRSSFRFFCYVIVGFFFFEVVGSFYRVGYFESYGIGFCFRSIFVFSRFCSFIFVSY